LPSCRATATSNAAPSCLTNQIAHEIEHIDDGQVTRRIDSVVRTQHRDVNDPKQWTWDEFGASCGEIIKEVTVARDAG
jgi:hypothetical protein